MRLIQEAADQELSWRQPSVLRQEFELRAGEETLATLRWQKAFGSLALAEAADGRWTFKRAGFWQPRVTVRAAGSDVDIAVFKPEGWSGGGALTTERGSTFRWAGKGLWRSQWTWHGPDDVELVRFTGGQGLKTEGWMTLAAVAATLPEVAQLDDLYRPVPEGERVPPAAALPELGLLVTLGWYLLVLAAQDAAGAAGTGD